MASSDQAKPTLLYVDDEEMNIYLFQKAFESDFEIVSAASGEAGLQKLEEYGDQIKAVVTDMRMPNMNGIELVKKARQKHEQIPYFILTGFDCNEEIEAALENKAIREYFTKPFDAPKIKAALKAAL